MLDLPIFSLLTGIIGGLLNGVIYYPLKYFWIFWIFISLLKTLKFEPVRRSKVFLNLRTGEVSKKDENDGIYQCFGAFMLTYMCGMFVFMLVLLVLADVFKIPIIIRLINEFASLSY